ncbi:hypothetical protein [Halorussus sp. MSC15.2]|uniref:DUF7269 family protein n=1 Tax=Halorussus sp. MSC15.2 TaxID=2283638 RepID=UPI0013D15FF7|nr:hypothetical protein [Halorussus sp. MSC15.2]NEU58201.1 hypothetical protein [Halorussus sp. MSC15.2]
MIPRLLGRASARVQQPQTLAVVGGVSLAFALGVAFLPWLFPPGVFRPISTVVASPISILLFGVAAGLLGANAFRESATGASSGDSESGPHAVGFDRRTRDRVPERGYYDEHRTTGETVDSVLGANPDETDDLYARRRNVRGRIRETAISVVADAERIDSETAADRISAGSWTDDPRAAAFLGGRHLAPLRTRIRDWASGERFERWATRAVAEIETIEGGEASGPNIDAGSRGSTTASGDVRERNRDARLEVAER